jgi:hypothetical protein
MDTQTILAMLARHALTVAAGWLATKGYIDSSATEGVISAGMTVAAVGWSWWQKTGQAEIAAELVKLKAQKNATTAQAVRDAMNAAKP